MNIFLGLITVLYILMGEKRRVSLVIPVYNRPEIVQNALAYPIFDRRIDEILIYDDGSSPENYQTMLSLVKKNHSRVKIVRGGKNLGPFAAKFNAVKQCRNDWVILLDSDNSININYVSRLFNLTYWSEDTIYCPDFARPHFNFREFSDEIIDIDKARELLSSNEHKPRFVSTLLNTGNYFLYRRNFVECLREYVKYRIPAGDVLMANYLWMNSGRYLKVLSKLSYNHLVHDGSNFKKEGVPRQNMIRQIREAIIAGDTVDFERYFNKIENIF